MTPTTPNDTCTVFRDRLDAWLAGEYDDARMWTHHDGCEACRMEARLARDISGVLTALPLLPGPHIPTPAGARTRHGIISRLLQAWRQPLVFVPALALFVAVLALPQLRAPDTAVEPELVIIDGRAYTREEIRKAAEDLQLALRYLDRYRPAQVISAELSDGNAAPATGDDDNSPDGRAVPTI